MAYAYTPLAFPGALDQVLGERRTREFSATVLIGGKLRALYNEAEQPSLSRLDELLQQLEGLSPSSADP
jgi:hypothetical protein